MMLDFFCYLDLIFSFSLSLSLSLSVFVCWFVCLSVSLSLSLSFPLSVSLSHISLDFHLILSATSASRSFLPRDSSCCRPRVPRVGVVNCKLFAAASSFVCRCADMQEWIEVLTNAITYSLHHQRPSLSLEEQELLSPTDDLASSPTSVSDSPTLPPSPDLKKDKWGHRVLRVWVSFLTHHSLLSLSFSLSPPPLSFSLSLPLYFYFPIFFSLLPSLSLSLSLSLHVNKLKTDSGILDVKFCVWKNAAEVSTSCF